MSKLIGPPTSSGFVLNVKPSKLTNQDYGLNRHPLSKDITPLPPKFDALTFKQRQRNQLAYGACVGFGITDAITYQLGLVDERWFGEPLSPMFVWMGSKEIDQWEQPSTLAGGDGTSIKCGLDITRKFGNLYDRFAPLGGITTYAGQQMYADASWLKITSYYNLKNNVEAICRWLSTNKQVVIGINVHQPFFEAKAKVLTEREAMGNSLGGHCCRIIAYSDYDPANPMKTVFRIGNSWGNSWGFNGNCWVDATWLANACFESYGINVPSISFFG